MRRVLVRTVLRAATPPSTARTRHDGPRRLDEETTMTKRISGDQPEAAGFLGAAEETDAVRRLYDEDVDDVGYVMNLSRVWAHEPVLQEGLSALIGSAADAAALTFRQRGILVSACASTMGDSYCSLAWGARLATATDADTAGGVLRGDDAGLDPAEQALARWARQIARDPNGIVAADVEVLRRAGFTDAQIFAITVFVAMRLAFSTVNAALGARPDRELVAGAPAAVVAAVTYGRPAAAGGDG
jgi:alkylhydroperoxidase family enzyme